jgi:acyl-CoA thioesterase I
MLKVAQSRKPMTVVALGTSLTHSGGWLKPFEKQLTECLGRPVNVLDYGRDGATSDWGVAILEEVIRAEPDVVLID